MYLIFETIDDGQNAKVIRPAMRDYLPPKFQFHNFTYESRRKRKCEQASMRGYGSHSDGESSQKLW